MNALADITTASRLTSVIEHAEAKRLGVSVAEARLAVARHVGASPGTIENIRRLRIKKIPAWLMDRIRAEFVAVLQAEIRRLEHEISIHMQAGVDHRDDRLAAALASVQTAKEILNSTGNS